MIHSENDRLVISCNRCPVRLDLGPQVMARGRNRMPSMWASVGNERHLCPSCAQNHAPRFAPARRPSPLFS